MKKRLIILLSLILVLIVEIIFLIVTNLNKIDRHASLSDIKFDDDKINIYVFWGNGCPHCENLFKSLEKNKKEYGKYYNIYAFEVWNDENNGKIMDYFLKKFDKEVGVRSVPFYVIGDEALSGYSSKMEEEVLNTIIKEYEERQDNQNFKDIKDIVLK